LIDRGRASALPFLNFRTMNKFSETSKERLSTCDLYLQKVMIKAIELSPIDFGIAQGARTIQEQKQYFNEGKSKINPDNYTEYQLPLKAKHIVTPEFPKSRAVDFYAYIPGKGASWSSKQMLVIIGVILAVDNSMEGRLRSGADWDQDGEFMTDQTFQDLPHIEIIK